MIARRSALLISSLLLLTAASSPRLQAAIDLTLGDSTVTPGEDFYRYANGQWLATTEIPADRSSWGVMDELRSKAEADVKALIEQAATRHAPVGTSDQKIGDYYTAFMNEAEIESRGLAPARADLDRIAKAKSKRDIAALFGLPGLPSSFSVNLAPDPENPNRYSVTLGTGRLGLPERNYYLKDDPEFAEIRTQYRVYIEQMLALAGVPQAARKAQAIMAFETEVAQAQWPIEKRRDIQANYTWRTKAQLLGYAPQFDWQTFFDAQELGTRERLVVTELTAIRDIAGIVDRTPVETLQAFLTFRYLSDNATYLPKVFDDANFAFYGRTLRGQPQQLERWKRAVDLVNRALGQQVGQLYVAAHFPPDSRAKMQALVANLCAALGERIDSRTWMTPQTKQRAREKLATFVANIGYPDQWRDYSTLEVRPTDPLGNIWRARQWEWRYQLARLDQPVDQKEWRMTPQTVNAAYFPLNNEVTFPAAILQAPFFDPDADPAVNYGAIGGVIGHEISHGFDDQGRRFDAEGRLADWWTPQDNDEFKRRAEVLVKQYSEFEALPGLPVNGAITLGENLGDLGGLTVAYQAYKLSLGGKPAPVINGLTGDQRFFLSWAQAWRAKFREGVARERAVSDVHSPPYFRVNGVVRNMDAWYTVFDIQPGDKLYLKPEDRASVW